MSLRSKLNLSSDFPYTEFILTDLSELFSRAYRIDYVRGGYVLLFREQPPFLYRDRIIYSTVFDPLTEEFVQVYQALVMNHTIADIVVDGLIDACPELRKTFKSYVKKKK